MCKLCLITTCKVNLLQLRRYTHWYFFSIAILRVIVKNRTCGRYPKFSRWRKTAIFSEKDNYLQCSPKDRLIQSVEHVFNSLTNFTLFMKITQHLRKTNQPIPPKSPILTVLSTFKKSAVVSCQPLYKTEDFSILWKTIKLDISIDPTLY